MVHETKTCSNLLSNFNKTGNQKYIQCLTLKAFESLLESVRHHWNDTVYCPDWETFQFTNWHQGIEKRQTVRFLNSTH